MVDFPFELKTIVDFEVKFMVVNFVTQLYTDFILFLNFFLFVLFLLED